jgi:DNA gyrase subunit A
MVTLSPVLGSEELFVLSENGILIRTSVAQVSSYGRSTQGVTVMRLDDGDRVVAAMVMPSEAELEAMN